MNKIVLDYQPPIDRMLADLRREIAELRTENERLTEKCASQAAELRQLDEEIQRLKQTITWLTCDEATRCVWIHPEAMDDVRTFAFPAFKVKPDGGEPFICFVERPSPDPAATDFRDPAPPA